MLGATGETIAAEFLRQKGIRVIARNFRTKWGEIDLIAQDTAGQLIFCEIKTACSGSSYLYPLAQKVNLAKYHKLRRAIVVYLQTRNLDLNCPWRFDIITIVINRNSKKPTSIEHLTNVSYYS